MYCRIVDCRTSEMKIKSAIKSYTTRSLDVQMLDRSALKTTYLLFQKNIFSFFHFHFLESNICVGGGGHNSGKVGVITAERNYMWILLLNCFPQLHR